VKNCPDKGLEKLEALDEGAVCIEALDPGIPRGEDVTEVSIELPLGVDRKVEPPLVHQNSFVCRGVRGSIVIVVLR
jgi:hypothetical protein